MEDFNKRVEQVMLRTGATWEQAEEALRKMHGSVEGAILLLASRRSKIRKETWTVKGNEVLDKLKALLKQGNVTRIVVKHKGRVLYDLNATTSLAFALLVPKLMIIAALTGALTSCTLEVIREEE